MKLLISLIGESGAGKGTVGMILDKKGFYRISIGDAVRNIYKIKYGESNPTRTQLHNFANNTRLKEGADVFLRSVLISTEVQKQSKLYIDGIRNIDELNYLNTTFLAGEHLIVGVVADTLIRYERVIKRGNSNDPLDFETFIKNDLLESGNNPNQLQTLECIKKAKFILKNNGTMEELTKQVNDFYEKEIKSRLSTKWQGNNTSY